MLNFGSLLAGQWRGLLATHALRYEVSKPNQKVAHLEDLFGEPLY